MSEKTIAVGSDFSGVGAFNQALKRIGVKYKEVFACDMDKYARQTFILNYGMPEYFPTDVYEREIPNESLDIFMTSPPCQAFSLSGKREGENDKRGILFYNSHEFIQKNKPRFFIFENVKGLLSHDKKNKDDEYGQTFNKWIQFLGGKSVNGNPILFPYDDSVPYHIYWKVINATDQNIPQNRERVFIVGIRDDEDNNFTWPADLPLTKRLKDVLEDIVDEKYFLSEKMLENIKYNGKTNGEIANLNKGGERGSVYSENSDYMTCLSATDYKQPKQIQVGTWRTHKDGQGFREIEDGNCPTIPARAREDGSGQPVIKVVSFERTEEEKKRRKDNFKKTGKDSGSFKGRQITFKDQDYFNTILANPNPKKEGLIFIESNTKKGFEKAEEEEDSINFSNPNSKTRWGRVGKKVAQTLDTQCNQGIFTQFRIRRLTPRECFRLMDFPEDFVWDVSDSQAYKQAGNSICVGVLAAIISKLKL